MHCKAKSINTLLEKMHKFYLLLSNQMVHMVTTVSRSVNTFHSRFNSGLYSSEKQKELIWLSTKQRYRTWDQQMRTNWQHVCSCQLCWIPHWTTYSLHFIVSNRNYWSNDWQSAEAKRISATGRGESNRRPYLSTLSSHLFID